MRLLSLQVKGVSCFRNPIKIEDFDPHINIIYGPNEIGKSTLVTSLARAFFDKSSSRGQEIENLRPWGTSLSPEIAVEFVAGHDKRFMLEKGFLDNPYTRLSEWTGLGYELLADGDRAEEIVRKMWKSSIPGRGATKIDHWGLARLLWFRQEKERFDPPRLNDEVLLNELRQTLDIMTISKEEEKLFGTLAAELGRIVTSKRRDFVAGSRIAELMRQRDEFREKIVSLEGKLDLVETLSGRISQLTSDIDERERARGAKNAKLQSLKGEVERVRQLRENLKIAESELQVLQSRQDGLRRDRETIKQARALIEELDSSIHKTQEQLAGTLKELQELENDADEKEKALKQLSERVRQAKSDLERCRRIGQLRSFAKELEAKRSLLSKLERLSSELDATRAELLSMSIPTEADVRKAERLKETIAALEAKLEAVGLSFEVDAHADIEIAFESETGEAETRSISKGGSESFSASREAVLSVPNLLTVTVKSGSGEAVLVQEELQDAKDELRALLNKYSVDSTTDMHRAIAAGDRLKDKEKRLKEEIDSFGVTGVVDLLAEIKQLQSRLEFGLSDEGLDITGLQTADLDDEAQLSARLDELERDQGCLQGELARLRDAAFSLKEHRSLLSSQIENLKDQIARERARIHDVLESYDRDDSVLDQQYARLCLDVEQKQKAIEALGKMLPSDSDDPEKLSKALEIEIQNIDKDLRQKQDELSWTQGQLENLASDDLYLEMSRAEEQLKITEQELHRELVKARALSLIMTLHEAHRQAMTVGLAAPIEDRVSSYWRFVRDKDGVRAKLGHDMELSLLDAGGVDVDRDLFSAGAREQLYVVVRLAIAELLSQNEPQIVVLDDALVFTDRYRHARMLELIERLSERLQVIILTSHYDRFDSLPGRRYDLAELRYRALTG
ncbi:MAG: hypothetical protein WAQ58_09810 [Bacillota bacterium]